MKAKHAVIATFFGWVILPFVQSATLESADSKHHTYHNEFKGKIKPTEYLIEQAKKRHSDMIIISTSTDKYFYSKPTERIHYFLPDKKQNRIMLLDKITGNIIDDQPYGKPEKSNFISLENSIKMAKEQYHIVKILRTKLIQKKEDSYRVIYYIDKNKQNRTLVINAYTGEIISNKSHQIMNTNHLISM